MAKKLLLLMLMFSLTLVFGSVALAQMDDDDDDDDMADDDDDMADDDDAADDDDTGGDFTDSYLEFDSPTSLEPDSEYEFNLTVYNAATFEEKGKQGEWIYAIDLTMPSVDYVVDTETLVGPDPIHGNTGDEFEITGWEANFDPTSATISWQCFGVVTSANYGDIREGDLLQFQFMATTDAEATDGFPWVLHGDLGTDVDGVAFIGEEPDDDDDDDDTDDDDMGGRSDDDDDGGGCGC
jgi:hypothetical protein